MLRRKLAPHLAVLLENTAYTATLALFLLAESDAEREEALHDLGITADDVDALSTAIGAVSEEDKHRQRRWFSAIVATLSRTSTSFRQSSSRTSTRSSCGRGCRPTLRDSSSSAAADRRFERT